MSLEKRTGKLGVTGDLTVAGDAKMRSLNVVEQVLIEGDLVVKGKLVYDIPKTTPEPPVNNRVIFLGDPELDGCWRILADEDGSLMIEKRVDGEWEPRQSMI